MEVVRGVGQSTVVMWVSRVRMVGLVRRGVDKRFGALGRRPWRRGPARTPALA